MLLGLKLSSTRCTWKWFRFLDFFLDCSWFIGGKNWSSCVKSKLSLRPLIWKHRKSLKLFPAVDSMLSYIFTWLKFIFMLLKNGFLWLLVLIDLLKFFWFFHVSTKAYGNTRTTNKYTGSVSWNDRTGTLNFKKWCKKSNNFFWTVLFLLMPWSNLK